MVSEKSTDELLSLCTKDKCPEGTLEKIKNTVSFINLLQHFDDNSSYNK